MHELTLTLVDIHDRTNTLQFLSRRLSKFPTQWSSTARQELQRSHVELRCRRMMHQCKTNRRNDEEASDPVTFNVSATSDGIEFRHNDNLDAEKELEEE